MRIILTCSMLMPCSLLMAAACSGGGDETAKADQPKKAALIEAGQWETTTEVVKLVQKDKGTPKINTPAGTKTVASVCIGADEVAKPNPMLFAGTDSECTYGNFYMSGGTVNASLSCTRKGLDGKIMMTAYGDYEAQAFTTELDTATYFPADGDVNILAKVTGRRTGDCVPEAEGAAKKS